MKRKLTKTKEMKTLYDRLDKVHKSQLEDIKEELPLTYNKVIEILKKEYYWTALRLGDYIELISILKLKLDIQPSKLFELNKR